MRESHVPTCCFSGCQNSKQLKGIVIRRSVSEFKYAYLILETSVNYEFRQTWNAVIISPGSLIFPVCPFYQSLQLPQTWEGRQWVKHFGPADPPSISSCTAVGTLVLSTNAQLPNILLLPSNFLLQQHRVYHTLLIIHTLLLNFFFSDWLMCKYAECIENVCA